jgi:hypothetical protein
MTYNTVLLIASRKTAINVAIVQVIVSPFNSTNNLVKTTNVIDPTILEFGIQFCVMFLSELPLRCKKLFGRSRGNKFL